MAIFPNMESNNKNISSPILEKQKLITKIACFLRENPYTSTHDIVNDVKKTLESIGHIGQTQENIGGGIYSYNKRISQKDILLINECIYDLLFDRVITPGIGEGQMELPYIHVSDMTKLETYLNN